MDNLESYLLWRRDVPLSIAPFSPVDALLLSQLSYTDFEGCVGQGEEVPLETARERFWQLHTREEITGKKSFTAGAPLLMDLMAGEARFQGMRLFDYESILDTAETGQMAAVSFRLPDGTVFVAYRGTDGTLVGWKEDFTLSYLPVTEGQKKAAEYLEEIAEKTAAPLRVGGHSKGGNFAVFAAATAKAAVRNRILAVYNMDGPGFANGLPDSEGYREIQSRVCTVVPVDTVIGALLGGKTQPWVVKSSARGLLQHDAMTWQVLGTDFVHCPERSELSRFIEDTLSRWIESMDRETREHFVNQLFAFFEATGSQSFSQMSGNLIYSAEAMLRTAGEMPDRERREFLEILARLFQSGGESAAQEVQTGVGRLQRRALQLLGMPGDY